MRWRNTTGQRWALTADGQRAVPADDPAAAYLLVGVDGELDAAVAARYGLPGAAGGAKHVPAPPATKERRPAATKER